MIRCIPTSGQDTALRLTNALWSLALPADMRGNAVTSQMFGTVTCTDGTVWLEVDTEFAIVVHESAELDGIADVLQPWINEGALSAEMRGQRLTVWDAFPDFFKGQSKTRSELISLNLLSSPRS